MSVYYKFKSSLTSDKVTFDGLHISVGDLKKAIIQQKKIGKSNDFDLQITNAQTKEVYDSDDVLIQKNTTVVVARVPLANAPKKNWKDDTEENSVSNNGALFSLTSLDKIIKNSDLSKSDASEEEKIKKMITQSTQDYDSSKFVRGRAAMNGPVPPNYLCYRCGLTGHYIKNCPTNPSEIVKRSTGIPRSFMLPASADQKGALLTPSGEYVVPIIDHQAYKTVKKERPPFFPTEEEPEAKEPEFPEELKCLLCNGLLQDAVTIPCCVNSYCDECIRTKLIESEQHECPSCHAVNQSPDSLLPNRYLRNLVLRFKSNSKNSNSNANVPTENSVSSVPHSSSNNNKVVFNFKQPVISATEHDPSPVSDKVVEQSNLISNVNPENSESTDSKVPDSEIEHRSSQNEHDGAGNGSPISENINADVPKEPKIVASDLAPVSGSYPATKEDNTENAISDSDKDPHSQETNMQQSDERRDDRSDSYGRNKELYPYDPSNNEFRGNRDRWNDERDHNQRDYDYPNQNARYHPNNRNFQNGYHPPYDKQMNYNGGNCRNMGNRNNDMNRHPMHNQGNRNYNSGMNQYGHQGNYNNYNNGPNYNHNYNDNRANRGPRNNMNGPQLLHMPNSRPNNHSNSNNLYQNDGFGRFSPAMNNGTRNNFVGQNMPIGHAGEMNYSKSQTSIPYSSSSTSASNYADAPRNADGTFKRYEDYEQALDNFAKQLEEKARLDPPRPSGRSRHSRRSRSQSLNSRSSQSASRSSSSGSSRSGSSFSHSRSRRSYSRNKRTADSKSKKTSRYSRSKRSRSKTKARSNKEHRETSSTAHRSSKRSRSRSPPHSSSTSRRNTSRAKDAASRTAGLNRYSPSISSSKPQMDVPADDPKLSRDHKSGSGRSGHSLHYSTRPEHIRSKEDQPLIMPTAEVEQTNFYKSSGPFSSDNFVNDSPQIPITLNRVNPNLSVVTCVTDPILSKESELSATLPIISEKVTSEIKDLNTDQYFKTRSTDVDVSAAESKSKPASPAGENMNEAKDSINYPPDLMTSIAFDTSNTDSISDAAAIGTNDEAYATKEARSKEKRDRQSRPKEQERDKRKSDKSSGHVHKDKHRSRSRDRHRSRKEKKSSKRVSSDGKENKATLEKDRRERSESSVREEKRKKTDDESRSKRSNKKDHDDHDNRSHHHDEDGEHKRKSKRSHRDHLDEEVSGRKEKRPTRSETDVKHEKTDHDSQDDLNDLNRSKESVDYGKSDRDSKDKRKTDEEKEVLKEHCDTVEKSKKSSKKDKRKERGRDKPYEEDREERKRKRDSADDESVKKSKKHKKHKEREKERTKESGEKSSRSAKGHKKSKRSTVDRFMDERHIRDKKVKSFA